jgi:tetratricopeptide (TPR) repeat protein
MSADREALSRALGNLLDNAVKYSPEAAKKVESVDGDLKGAIERYKTLAQNNDRAVAARALVRLAECYRKLGEADARAVYERVVREFADQVESAAAARARLGGCIGYCPERHFARRAVSGLSGRRGFRRTERSIRSRPFNRSESPTDIGVGDDHTCQPGLLARREAGGVRVWDNMDSGDSSFKAPHTAHLRRRVGISRPPQQH